MFFIDYTSKQVEKKVLGRENLCEEKFIAKLCDDYGFYSVAHCDKSQQRKVLGTHRTSPFDFMLKFKVIRNSNQSSDESTET